MKVILVYAVGFALTAGVAFDFFRQIDDSCYRDRSCYPYVMASTDVGNGAASVMGALLWPISLPLFTFGDWEARQDVPHWHRK